MSRVPGTFKNRPPLPVRDRSVEGQRAECLIEKSIGALNAQRYFVGQCAVMLAREPVGRGETRYRWHLSISHPSRYPTWDEIKTAIYGLHALDGIVMAQVLSPVEDDDEWVDVHENCFHLYEINDDAFQAKP